MFGTQPLDYADGFDSVATLRGDILSDERVETQDQKNEVCEPCDDFFGGGKPVMHENSLERKPKSSSLVPALTGLVIRTYTPSGYYRHPL
jgi:hypothetical protein